ncbi:bifunctional DNA primase/polymerase [Gemmatimonas sp.]|uniref:bifunctional DNA primase/polymerase n=1 Tax=Gemmatimonas sp. TaxID=1962908 RepID=UPI00391F6644
MHDAARCRDLAAAAVHYATAFRWPIRPQHGFRYDGTCTCGNQCAPRDRGKHPARKGWQTMGTTDPALIASWWRLVPFNIATQLAGVVAVDVDDDTALAALAPFGPWPITPTQRTGRGWHLFFQVPAGGLPSLAPIRGTAIETKGEGASLTLAPSRHQTGTLYRWVHRPDDTPLAPLPAAFLDHMRTVEHRRARAIARRPPVDPTAPASVVSLLKHRAERAQRTSQGLTRGLYGVRRTLEEAGATSPQVAAAERLWWRLHGQTGAR